MENQISQIGKKLNKKELRTIKGGLINCMEPVLCPTPCEPSSDPYGCTIISPKCAQKECRPEL
ncbi:bacteriocin [Chryseobacterium gleum]|jgi:bacteriocin-like protein|uniref:bacteriocin n=1 Tax=Chryseobacterium gleum TaxID=250 RepID=UPI00241E2C5B|nr:bacteriocin [Chryseobacterium gleum]